MARKQPFDAAQSITDEIIDILETGTLPWRKPWRVAGSSVPLRPNGEAYKGINSFLLSMRTMVHGYSSPYWMTMKQANDLGARVIKGQRSSVVVYYGTALKDANTETSDAQTTETVGTSVGIRFMKSYRAFNADQIKGLPEAFHPGLAEDDDPVAKPIAAYQSFFDNIGGTVRYGGDRACYVPTLDVINMPKIERFRDPEQFYATLAHEYVHYTKAAHRLNRSYGPSQFGNASYSKEELCAEVGAQMLGRHLGFTPFHIDNSAAYIQSWLKILGEDKRAIFRAAADAQRACDWLIEASEAGGRKAAA